MDNSSLTAVESKTQFKLYHVVTEPTYYIWTSSSVVEQITVNCELGLEFESTRPVGFPTGQVIHLVHHHIIFITPKIELPERRDQVNE